MNKPEKTNELPRRSFFSALAFAPLAWLGLRKPEPENESRPYPFYGTWKKCAEAWENTARLRDEVADRWRERLQAAEKDADFWEGRTLEAEFDMECMGAMPIDEEMLKQSRLEYDQGLSCTAKEIRDELTELRKEWA